MDWDQSKVNVEFEGENYYLAGKQMGLLRANHICLLDLGLTMVNTPRQLAKLAGGNPKDKRTKKAIMQQAFIFKVYKRLMKEDVVEQPITDSFGRRVIKTVTQSRYDNPGFEKSMVEGANDAMPNHTFRLWEANFNTILPHLVWQPHVPNHEGLPTQLMIDAALEPVYNHPRQTGLTAIRETLEGLRDEEDMKFMMSKIPEYVQTFDINTCDDEADEATMEKLSNA